MTRKTLILGTASLLMVVRLYAQTLEGQSPKTSVDYYETSGQCAVVPGYGAGNSTPFSKCITIGACTRYQITRITCEGSAGQSNCTPDTVVVPIANGNCGWGFIPVLSDCTCRY